MEAAAEALAEFDVPHEVDVVSAHRMPQAMLDYAQAGRRARTEGDHRRRRGSRAPARHARRGDPVAGDRGCRCRSHLDGLDSLLSIVQMPAGVPVATVAIGNARNAACSRCASWVTADRDLRNRMSDFQQDLNIPSPRPRGGRCGRR